MESDYEEEKVVKKNVENPSDDEYSEDVKKKINYGEK